ncbi:MAG: DUF3108 domain-containing protein [Gammaproteobacteria bacterium]|nr:DUF3108 domain-containing protein [Gammaproteobacteria bacterium]
MKTPTVRPLLCAALCCLLAASPVVAAAQDLVFQVVYRGVFSLGNDMPIADVTLRAAAPPAAEIDLRASSEHYPTVESLYPIRYRFRSWSDPQTGHLRGFEAYEKTRREKHRVYVRDAASDMRRYDMSDAAARQAVQTLQQGGSAAPAVLQPLFDRLGLLQHLRRQALADGAAFDVPVTDGKDRIHYRVSVERSTTLRLGGVAVPAWKLRLDASETDARGREQTAHRPAYLWLSRDRDHVPLRIDVRHAIGRFRAELTTPQALQRIALAR